MANDIPISELFRLKSVEWVEADKAARMLEDSKSAVTSQMISRTIGNTKMAFNRAEFTVKASKEYSEYIEKVVLAKTEANLLKVEVEYLRMRFSEQQSAEANARAERRL